MASLRRTTLFLLTALLLSGCLNPLRHDAPRGDAAASAQEKWWAANFSRAEFVAGQGYRVPGTPGYFDDKGNPLTPDARAAMSRQRQSEEGVPLDSNFMSNLTRRVTGQESAERSTASTPVLGEPAPDLTPEQAQWWRTNRHLARWVPDRGYQIVSVEGYFDAVGHLTPTGMAARNSVVAPVSYNQPIDQNPTGGPPPLATPNPTSSVADNSYAPEKTKDDDGSLFSWVPWVGAKKKADPPKARAAYAEAETAFRERRFDAAAESYARAAGEWMDSRLEEDALFMQGESLFFADRYPDAFEAYEKLLNRYRRSRHLEKAVAREFAIGQYWFQLDAKSPQSLLQVNLTDKTRPWMDTLGWALKAMDKVRLNDPTGPLADDSLMATGNSYFIRQKYHDADYHYTLLRREYSKSEHQYNAHILGIQAKYRCYQGSDYNGTPLRETAELIDQTMVQFSRMPPKEREDLLKIKEEIVNKRAERDWKMAQYYEKQEYYGAARFYYDSLIKTYPQTQVALAAEKRMAEIGSLPSQPPPRLAWLTSLVPEPADPKKLTIRGDSVPVSNDGTVRR